MMGSNVFVCLPVFIREQPVDHHYQLSFIIYVRDFMEHNIPVPGKCAVTLEGFTKPLIADCDVSVFVKLGFLPIVSKDENSLRKSYINPSRIKSVREYLGGQPKKYMIVMDEINPTSKEQKPYTFVTTDNIIKLLNTTKHLDGSST